MNLVFHNSYGKMVQMLDRNLNGSNRWIAVYDLERYSGFLPKYDFLKAKGKKFGIIKFLYPYYNPNNSESFTSENIKIENLQYVDEPEEIDCFLERLKINLNNFLAPWMIDFPLEW